MILSPYFIQAAHVGGPRVKPVRLVVIHTAECREVEGAARAVANYFATNPDCPDASAHYVCDDAEFVQCVAEDVVAWGAPGANDDGIHVEHAGYAAQVERDWGDAYSAAMMKISAELVAGICDRWGVPPVRLSVEDIRAGRAGICGHVDVTNALNKGRGHQDPGPSFPWARYAELVCDAHAALPLQRQ